VISRINAILALLLVIVAGLSAWARVDVSRRNIEIFPGMKYTPAWQAFSANPVFPDGKTMQAPVAGSIARGEMPLHYTPSKEDAVRAGEELRNPFALSEEALRPPPELKTDQDLIAATTPIATSETLPIQQNTAPEAILAASVARGGNLFRIYCIACHGSKGIGDGPVTLRGFPPPPSLLTGKSLQMKDGQVFHILTYGQGSMSAFSGQLSPSRRWDLVNYVRSMQRSTLPESPGGTP
jgi:mono/diheme cytochrome c family protein